MSASRCVDCGIEILWGPSATQLERELELCSSCPSSDEARAALAEGLIAGARGGSSEDVSATHELYLALVVPPYSHDEYPLRRAWKQGWWAGLRRLGEGLDVARTQLLGVLAARAEQLSEAPVVLWFCWCGHVGGASSLRPSPSGSLVCPACGASGNLASDGGDPSVRARLRAGQARPRAMPRRELLDVLERKVAACPELGGDILGHVLTIGSGAAAIGVASGTSIGARQGGGR